MRLLIDFGVVLGIALNSGCIFYDKHVFDTCLISNSGVHIEGLVFMLNVYGLCHSLLESVGVNCLKSVMLDDNESIVIFA